jgi:competence protein ComEA
MAQFLVLIIVCFSLCACVRSHTKPIFSANGGKLSAATAVNINTASLAELEKLPSIGENYARKIIEHREKYGNFRRAEHLLLIEGISDRKFRQISERVKVE